IRDLQTILETLAEFAAVTKDAEILTESVRQALSRGITRQFRNTDGSLSVLILDPSAERTMLESLQSTPQGTFLNLDPVTSEKFLDGVKKRFEESLAKGYQPLILCSPAIRRFVKKIVERVSPGIVVLSHGEVSPNTKLYALGTIRIE
ncbi:MAG TPA: FHIPEP family type III secretion protein, partial [Dissulfurispiraceae bacterium]|nr:FHIPEP family type III secretion protein [Dissulfurispiraceae bacterium]